MDMTTSKELQDLKNLTFKSVSDLYNYFQKNITNYSYSSKQSMLEYLDKYDEYKNTRGFIQDCYNILNSINYNYVNQTNAILRQFVESTDTDIRNFIESQLNKENIKLNKSNEDLQKRNSALYNSNKNLLQYKENYKADGSSKVLTENEELKESIEKLKTENRKLLAELNELESLKRNIQRLNDLSSTS